MSRFSTENLKVGDRVIVISSNFGDTFEYIGEVIKKTPTGMVDVRYRNGIVYRFRENGSAYCKPDRYSRKSIWLEEFTKEGADAIIQRNRRNGIINFLKEREWNTYEDTELEKIYAYIKGLRNPHEGL